jgi:hypothetical protein
MWVSPYDARFSANITPTSNVYSTNNKNQENRWSYDNAGNLPNVNCLTATYNAENHFLR